MELTSPSIIKEILAKYGAKPSKGLGQNFLIDKRVLEKIINSAEIKPSDFVLEVGPGLGTLTKELASRAEKVVAIEKDQTMINILEETLKDFKKVEIIQGDFLKIFDSQFSSYKVVANIPYYITAPIIRALLENKNQPETIILLLQKEVAQRICAKKGDMSLLAVSVQFYATAKIISNVSKNCFWPSPKVDSAIIKIIPHKSPASVNPELFFEIVKAGFIQPRKQLVNNLTTLKSLNGVKLDKYKVTEWLLKNNIGEKQRAETLSVEDWVKLCQNF
jgi:16S rRNA (adenine1518-N6/adenine1519-N6)-dimethyltransferase